MKKSTRIGWVIVLFLVGMYVLYRYYYAVDCPPRRNPKKFPDPWYDNQIPHGDLGSLAEQFANPVLGEDTQINGALVGGFFKGIDVYPSEAAAKYYKPYLIRYLQSSKALPYWNMAIGELLCQKTQ